jgi:hypothetical protein
MAPPVWAVPGLYEFVRVTNVAGSVITFTPKLSNQYFYQDAGASTAQKRYQVVRTLQFASATTTVAIIAPYWNGKTGGVVAMDVRDTLNLQNQAVEGESAAIFVAGKGFRGGFGRNLDHHRRHQHRTRLRHDICQ